VIIVIVKRKKPLEDAGESKKPEQKTNFETSAANLTPTNRLPPVNYQDMYARDPAQIDIMQPQIPLEYEVVSGVPVYQQNEPMYAGPNMYM
jgi:hypothetical protein